MWNLFGKKSELDEDVIKARKEIDLIRKEVKASAAKIAEASTRFVTIVDMHAQELEKARLLRSNLDKARDA